MIYGLFEASRTTQKIVELRIFYFKKVFYNLKSRKASFGHRIQWSMLLEFATHGMRFPKTQTRSYHASCHGRGKSGVPMRLHSWYLYCHYTSHRKCFQGFRFRSQCLKGVREFHANFSQLISRHSHVYSYFREQHATLNG